MSTLWSWARGRTGTGAMRLPSKTSTGALLFCVAALVVYARGARAHEPKYTRVQTEAVEAFFRAVTTKIGKRAEPQHDAASLSTMLAVIPDEDIGHLLHCKPYLALPDRVRTHARSSIRTVRYYRLVRPLGADSSEMARLLASRVAQDRARAKARLSRQSVDSATRRVMQSLARDSDPEVRLLAIAACIYIARMDIHRKVFTPNWFKVFVGAAITDRDPKVAAGAVWWAACSRLDDVPRILIPALRDMRELAVGRPLAPRTMTVASRAAAAIYGEYGIQAMPWESRPPASGSVEDVLKFCVAWKRETPSRAEGWRLELDVVLNLGVGVARPVICASGIPLTVTLGHYRTGLDFRGAWSVDARVNLVNAGARQTEALRYPVMKVFGSGAVGGSGVNIFPNADYVEYAWLVDGMPAKNGDVRVRLTIWVKS